MCRLLKTILLPTPENDVVEDVSRASLKRLLARLYKYNLINDKQLNRYSLYGHMLKIRITCEDDVMSNFHGRSDAELYRFKKDLRNEEYHMRSFIKSLYFDGKLDMDLARMHGVTEKWLRG